MARRKNKSAWTMTKIGNHWYEIGLLNDSIFLPIFHVRWRVVADEALKLLQGRKSNMTMGCFLRMLKSGVEIKEVLSMSNYLETLPQYHFERDDFVNTFYEVFTEEEMLSIEDMFNYPKITDEFMLCRNSDEFYIIHFNSGTIINWYKHLGRTNTCNKKEFSLEDLKEMLTLLKEDLEGA